MSITLDQVTKYYAGAPVVNDVSLDIGDGEFFVLLGPSGSGKSTLLRAIAGLDVHPLGTIAVEGDVGYVFQEPRLFPWLNVEKNVRFAARTPEERERVDDVLELTGLQDARETLPKALSGGMAQRAALARALVRKPSVLLLDEPLASLDALRRMQLQEAIAEIIAAVGATAILVTHDIEEALYLADRIVVLGGSPSRIALEIVIPPHKRRNRDANLTAERSTLFHALSGDETREQESA